MDGLNENDLCFTFSCCSADEVKEVHVVNGVGLCYCSGPVVFYLPACVSVLKLEFLMAGRADKDAPISGGAGSSQCVVWYGVPSVASQARGMMEVCPDLQRSCVVRHTTQERRNKQAHEKGNKGTEGKEEEESSRVFKYV